MTFATMFAGLCKDAHTTQLSECSRAGTWLHLAPICTRHSGSLTSVWRERRESSVIERDVSLIVKSLNVCAVQGPLESDCDGCSYKGLNNCVSLLTGDASVVIQALLPLAEKQAEEAGKAQQFPVSPVTELTRKKHKKPRVYYDRRGNYGSGRY